MNTLLAPQRPSGLPDTLRLPSRDTRTSLLDRLALHLGLRLLLWSTRTPRLADDRRRHAQTYRHQEATAEGHVAYLPLARLAPGRLRQRGPPPPRGRRTPPLDHTYRHRKDALT